MRCGCVAMTTQTLPDGSTRPACFTHLGLPESVEVDETFTMPTDRIARCAYGCGEERPSSPALAFYEYRGEGSSYALTGCGNCGYNVTAHTEERRAQPHLQGKLCAEFTPRGPHEFDIYYSGCRGWD
jgi:hypothetical protein